MKLRIRVAIIALYVFSIGCSAPAQNWLSPQPSERSESESVTDTVTKMFTYLRDDNVEGFYSVTDPDIIIFDAGAKFTRASMLGIIKEQHAAGKSIVWTVTAPDVHISGSTAWIDYVNVGVLTTPSGTIPLKWLESAVLQNKNGRWKIEFLHSTLVPDKVRDTKK